ncbi:DegT/DnrJ/EryC1/StrS aminotransferase family protein [Cognatishimia sp. MH4019]|uniref:DegT/DnrJ/EryC1/StrS family aminotransferase n=1 Tax=Cognatishimia sp. MH4019 TaxID=2854030 RepID=UPI001CD51685|nr:DegT/DnrJ/EryC1/StrS aminotransferase family protein [Cognatishimia sp. MH4019]
MSHTQPPTKPSWPHYDSEQIDAVSAVLHSGKVNAWTGPDVRAFEEEYAAALGVKHALAMANGSVTLNAALQVLGLQPGDEVIVTPRSFVVSASCVPLFGGRAVFADVDPDTQNITPATIAKQITPRTRGIIAVHLGGWPCDMDGIMALANDHGLWVIEDCAQAHGAMIDDRPVGSFGTMASFSFCQDKIMTTGGEGGLLVTNDDTLWRKAWSYKDHGKDYATVFETEHAPGFRWLHEHPGTNLRMSGMAAAIGRVQLKRLPEWTAHRTRIAGIFADAFTPLPALRTPLPAPGFTHAWYRFYTFVRPERLAPGWDRDRILAEITEAGFPTFSGSCSEIYREKLFEGAVDAPLPIARDLGETSMAFLTDPTISEADATALAECVTSIIARASA